MAVTATDESDRLFRSANRGKYVTVAAPGVDILVPAPDGGLQFTTGTSVAAARVSGVAALLLAKKPSLKPEEIRDILVTTAQRLGAGDINSQFGAGLADPLKALELIVSDKRASEQESIKRFSRGAGSKRHPCRTRFLGSRLCRPGPHRDQGVASWGGIARLARLDRCARHRFQQRDLRPRS